MREIPKWRQKLARSCRIKGPYASTSRRFAAILRVTRRAPVGPLRGDPPDPPPASVEQWTEVALARRQEVAIAAVRAEELALAVRMAEAMNRPAAGRGTALFERGMMADAPSRGDMTGSMAQGETAYGERIAEAEPGYGAAEAYLAEMRRRQAAAEFELEGKRLETGALVSERALAWRSAHQIVGILVRLCEERGLGPADVTPGLLDEAAIAYHEKPAGLDQDAIRAALDPERFIASRTVRGGPAAAESLRQAKLFEELLAADEKTVAAIDARLERSGRALEQAVDAVIRKAA